MKNQYLLLAESILYKNNKLTAINVYDQFLAMDLPAKFVFDLVILCGPGWEPGDYNLDIFVKIDSQEELKLGNINLNIPHENFVYNAIASDLSLGVPEGVKDVLFVVKSADEVILERNYQINILSVKEG